MTITDDIVLLTKSELKKFRNCIEKKELISSEKSKVMVFEKRKG